MLLLQDHVAADDGRKPEFRPKAGNKDKKASEDRAGCLHGVKSRLAGRLVSLMPISRSH